LIHQHKPQFLLSLCKRLVFLGFWRSVHQSERETVGPVNVYCQSGWPRWVCCVMSDTFLGCFPLADRKRAAVQHPETISTYLLLGIVDSIFLHIVYNPVCPCCMNCGWLTSVLFCQGRPVSNGPCRRIGKTIPPHVSDWWVLAQHI